MALYLVDETIKQALDDLFVTLGSVANQLDGAGESISEGGERLRALDDMAGVRIRDGGTWIAASADYLWSTLKIIGRISASLQEFVPAAPPPPVPPYDFDKWLADVKAATDVQGTDILTVLDQFADTNKE